MYDQFDNKLSSRIKDVFDNFEDNSADSGWAELRKRFPGKEKQKVVPFAWWQSAAAILLLALGTWTYTINHKEKIYLVGKPDEKNNNFKPGQVEPVFKEESIEAGPSATVAEPVTRTATLEREKIQVKSSINEPVKTFEEPESVEQDPILAAVSVAEESTEQETALSSPKKEKEIISTTGREDTNSLEYVTTAPVVKNKMDQAKVGLSPFDNVEENKRTSTEKRKPLSIGIYAGSYFNYAEWSESSMNTGLGISSEIGISKKLKLSTGIALAQNTLKFNSLIPESVSADFIAAREMEESTALKSGFGTAIASSYSLDKYNASLLGLDFPVNLKYTLIENKSQLYFVAGFSSNLYLDENYNYLYEVNSGKTSTFTQQEDEKASAKLKSFDFARMLNLSVGFGRPVGKQSRLSFEPFVKYPLGGQGVRDIRFGSAGMNLKLDFSTFSRKK